MAQRITTIPSFKNTYTAQRTGIVVSAGHDTLIKAWELHTGRLLKSFDVHAAPVKSLFAFPSCDNNYPQGLDFQLISFSLLFLGQIKSTGIIHICRCISIHVLISCISLLAFGDCKAFSF